ncbi:UNVERIFIED_CONTAM: hypothetical protein Sangu_3225200 [Sesamum angustifolium]|uniref:DUF4283 domain-containing protein n=1 Tax=Sesamum angustifolium TaxID=2727405 RepID=A0AAW2JIQ6_9LAMI
MDVNLPTPALEYQEQSAPPVIYVGNVKLQAGPNGEVIIRPTKEVVDNGSKKWHTTAVGYFLGRRPYFPQLESYARANWKGLQHVSATSSGFFFFSAGSRACPYDDNNTLMFQFGFASNTCRWSTGQKKVSALLLGIGTPLYSDGITKACSRLDYARVCVMLNYDSELPKHLVVISPVLRNGKEDPKRVDVEYEWLPQKCTTCCSLGHVEKFCPANSMKKTTAPPIKVFVKKRSVIPDTADTEQNTELAGVANSVSNSSGPSGLGKGKAIALYNSYGVLDTDY